MRRRIRLHRKAEVPRVDADRRADPAIDCEAVQNIAALAEQGADLDEVALGRGRKGGAESEHLLARALAVDRFHLLQHTGDESGGQRAGALGDFFDPLQPGPSVREGGVDLVHLASKRSGAHQFQVRRFTGKRVFQEVEGRSVRREKTADSLAGDKRAQRVEEFGIADEWQSAPGVVGACIGIDVQ